MNWFARLFVLSFGVFSLVITYNSAHAHSTSDDLDVAFEHACAILTPQRRVYCWGTHSPHLGHSGPYPMLRAVAGMPHPASKISVGANGSCAIHNGSLYCWGSSAQLVSGLESNVTHVSVGSGHRCAIRSGDLYCWGSNEYGQVGNDIENDRVIYPTRILTGNVTDVSAGGMHTCAIQNGDLFCWGKNTFGELGVGPGVGLSRQPLLVLSGNVTRVIVGYEKTCAVRGQQVYCWGDNRGYGVGHPTATFVYTPHLLMDNVHVTGLTLGMANSLGCARNNNAQWWCWGRNNHGHLNWWLPSNHHFPSPTHMPHFDGLTHLNFGWGTAVRVDTQGCLVAWGLNLTGIMGRLPIVSGPFLPERVPGSCLHGFSFSKQAPANGSAGFGREVALSWMTPSSSDVRNYAYAITSVHSPVPVFVPAGLTNTVVLSNLEANTQYYWQVRACGDPDCTIIKGADNGQWFTFSTTNYPDNFSKLAPYNNAIVYNNLLNLEWYAVSGANHYRYCYAVATDPPCIPNVITTSLRVTIHGLAHLTAYRWQVRACADPACTVWTDANNGTHWRFRVILAPGFFEKLSPLDGVTEVPTSAIQLQWTASERADHYRLCISTLFYVCDIFGSAFFSVGDSLVYTATNLLPNTTYYWQVYACANIDCENYTHADIYSIPISFTTVAAPPGQFNKLSPANGHSPTGRELVLRWEHAPGAARYEYCVAPASESTCAFQLASGTSATLTNLITGTTYRWQVRACANNSCSAHTYANGGQEWSFSVAHAPIVRRVTPASGSQDLPATVRLEWVVDSGTPHHYRYCFGEVPFNCASYITTTETFVTIHNLLPGRTYAWRLIACAVPDCTVGTWADDGNLWFFSTAPLPPPFQKIAPANLATRLGRSPTLSWTVASPVHHYRYCISEVPNCIPTASIGTAHQAVADNLTPGQTYYWQVRACADALCTIYTDADQGAHHRFTVATRPQAFTKITPPHQGAVLTTSPVFTWEVKGDAHHYRFCIVLHHQTCVPVAPFSPPALNHGEAYRWQVRACADPQCTIWHDADGGSSFTFLVASSPFGKVFPYDHAELDETTITLRWQPSGAAQYYEYCYASINVGCNTWLSAGSSTSVTIGPLGRGITYTWQVRACADSGCLAVREADQEQRWHFRVRTPSQLIRAHGLLTKTLSGTSKYNTPTLYRIEIANPMSEPAHFTMTELLPPQSTLISVTSEQGVIPVSNHSWTAVLSPGGYAVYTASVSYSLLGSSVNERTVVNRVIISDAHQASHFAEASHLVHLHKSYLPLIAICRPQPDEFEPDSIQQPLSLRQDVIVARTLHSVSDVDYFSMTFTYHGVQTYTLRFEFSSLPVGTTFYISNVNNNLITYTSTITNSINRSVSFSFERREGNTTQVVRPLVWLHLPAHGSRACEVRYQAVYYLSLPIRNMTYGALNEQEGTQHDEDALIIHIDD